MTPARASESVQIKLKAGWYRTKHNEKMKRRLKKLRKINGILTGFGTNTRLEENPERACTPTRSDTKNWKAIPGHSSR